MRHVALGAAALLFATALPAAAQTAQIEQVRPDRSPEQVVDRIARTVELTDAQRADLIARLTPADGERLDRRAAQSAFSDVLTEAQQQSLRAAREQRRAERSPRGERLTPEQHAARMTQRLDLTPEQSEQLRALRADETLTREARRAAAQSILTPAQLDRMRQLRERRSENGQRAPRR